MGDCQRIERNNYICISPQFLYNIISAMAKNQLKDKIIAICGLGYVGLPVALLFAKAGFKVIGIDKSVDKVKKINLGQVTIVGKEPGLKELARQIHQKGNFS